ncbi:MAG: TonB-dependent receptor, partial [Acidobacteria bacterium]|nr:TonB-dependent receptor [Acidobacteriota bacterium]
MAKTVTATLLGFVFFGQLVWAQVTTGTISGVVRDATGAVVPGASVTVRNVETGVTRTLPSDAQGRYRAPNLSVGRYEIQVSLAGFQTAVRSGISLSVGQEAAVNFTLEVGQVTERVEVTGEAPLVEATRSDVSGVIDQSQVEDLPLNGRSYLQLAELQTGVVSARNSARTSTGLQQTSISVSGSQSTSGIFLLDGTDIVDYLYASAPGGSSGLAIGADMIREFRVLTNTYSAEYGRSAGGVVSVVSKSGTNQLQGTAFWLTRNDNLDARDFFDAVKPEFKRNQFGGTISGPIIRDKTFFLGSYEGLREGEGLTAVAIVPNARAHQGFLPVRGGGERFVGVAPNVKGHLDLYPLPNTGRDFGNGTGELRSVETQVANDDFFSARIDQVLSDQDTLFGRYTFRDGELNAPFTATPVPGFWAFGKNRNQFLTLQETHVFSPTVINTFRASMARLVPVSEVSTISEELSISVIPGRGPIKGLGEMTIRGQDGLGQRSSRPTQAWNTNFQFQDAVDFIRGGHSVKVGAEIIRYRVNFRYEQDFSGVYTFPNLENFLKGTPESYRGALAGSDGYRGWRWYTYGFFVQDDWRMLPNFTLNLGLRYEPYGNVSEVNGKLATLFDTQKGTEMTVVPEMFGTNPGTKLFQPRVGFAWDPFRNGKTAIRGGFGLFY